MSGDTRREADPPAHVLALQNMDVSMRKEYLAAYKQYEALQTVYDLAKDDSRNASKNTKGWLRHKMTSTIEQYAVSECRRLAEKISTTLPRELRDMIYAYIWDPETARKAFDNVRSHELCHTPWLRDCEGKRCQCFKIDEMPLYVQHQVVGLAFAREVVTAYYEAMHPERLGYDIHYLYTFLVYDHFHLGIKPAAHIRHLRLLVSPVHNASLAMNINNNVCVSSEGQNIIRESLDHLNLIANKKGFRLTIVLGDGIWGAWTEQMMENLHPIHKVLTEAGMRIRVYGKPSASYHLVQRIDNYFSLSFENWLTACQKARPTGAQSFVLMWEPEHKIYTWSHSASDGDE